MSDEPHQNETGHQKVARFFTSRLVASCHVKSSRVKSGQVLSRHAMQY